MLDIVKIQAPSTEREPPEQARNTDYGRQEVDHEELEPIVQRLRGSVGAEEVASLMANLVAEVGRLGNHLPEDQAVSIVDRLQSLYVEMKLHKHRQEAIAVSDALDYFSENVTIDE